MLAGRFAIKVAAHTGSAVDVDPGTDGEVAAFIVDAGTSEVPKEVAAGVEGIWLLIGTMLLGVMLITDSPKVELTLPEELGNANPDVIDEMLEMGRFDAVFEEKLVG